MPIWAWILVGLIVGGILGAVAGLLYIGSAFR